MTEAEVRQWMNSGNYPGEISVNPELVETHISWVVLAHEYAFKIKKPLQLSFLDFAALEDRKYYCERELTLNQRLTDDLYLAVLPIQKKDGSFYTGDVEGETVDYTVQMKKLDRQKEMPVLLKKDAISKRFIRLLADKVARFHQSTEVIHQVFDPHQLKQTFNDIQNVRDTIETLLGAAYANKLDEIVRTSDAFISAHEEDFQARYEQGMVRDCHGDLHSGNIFVYPEPIIFDCIEFNDQFRQIDVLNEIAFFCMDLEMYGKEDLARYFIDRYQHIFPVIHNETDKRLFVYYKCYRANVRAKVTALKAPQAHNEQDRKKVAGEAKHYIERMEHYLPALTTA